MTEHLFAGKLPPALLNALLLKMHGDDPSVVVGPGPGEDAAVVISKPNDLLVLKTDPITFATDRIGYYAVHVNANDIASAGAVPRWFLASLIFPIGTTRKTVEIVVDEINAAASSVGIVVCGGHTEVSDAVSRPLVCGSMIGTVPRKNLKDKGSVRPGQRIILTKTAGNEGTAVLAAEFGDALRRRGVEQEVINAAAGFLDRISVLPEAGIAGALPGVVAMHDVTEGGVATALTEIVVPTGFGLEVDIDAVAVDPVTLELCDACDLDPLGLIGSGSLLIAAEADSTDELLGLLAKERIPAGSVGIVREPEAGMCAVKGGKSVPFPRFAVDEITRMFS